MKDESYTEGQISAVKKLERLKVGALFMRPGTGKTRTSLWLVNHTDTDFCLFLVPYQTKENIKKEIKHWGLKTPFRIEGIETLSNSDRVYLELRELLQKSKKPFIVLDESLKIKNPYAKRTRRALELGKLSEYRLVLNGTPLSKNILDLWLQMEFLSHKILKMDYRQFKDTFCKYTQFRRELAYGYYSNWAEIIDGYMNLDYLYSLIEPYVYDSDLQLNHDKSYQTINYQVVENWNKYSALRATFLNRMKYGDTESFLKLTQAMQHSYCDEPNKIRELFGIVNDKTIVFTKFIRSKEAVEQAFPHTKVLTYGKGSLGLNLQNYNRIVFFDKTFDYAQRDQAEHRIYRMGQKDDVTYYDLTGDVNLEKTMDSNIERKQSLLSMFKEIIQTDDGNYKWGQLV